MEERDNDGRHESSLSKNSRNLNQRYAYGVSGRHTFGQHTARLSQSRDRGREPKRQICATNVAFGDIDGKSLYVTACDAVYRIRLKVAGAMPGPRTKKQEPRTRDARERTRGVPAARNRRSRTSAWRTTRICSTAIWITCEGCRRPRLRSGPGRDVSRCRWHPGRTRQWHRSTRTMSATGESAEARSSRAGR